MRTNFIALIIITLLLPLHASPQGKGANKRLEASPLEVGKRVGEVSDIKGRHIWNTEFKGRIVKWTGSVLTVEDLKERILSNNDGIQVQFDVIEFSLSGEIIVLAVFSRKWHDRLLEIEIGTSITVEGKLTDYSVLSPGIMPMVFLTVSECKLIQ